MLSDHFPPSTTVHDHFFSHKVYHNFVRNSTASAIHIAPGPYGSYSISGWRLPFAVQNAFYVWSPGLALRFGLIPLRWSGPTVKQKEDHPFGWSSFACVRQNLVFEPIFDSVSNDFNLFTSLQSAELSNRSQLDISSLSSRFQLNAGICFVPRISDCRWVVSLHCKL